MIALFSANTIQAELLDCFLNWKTFVGILMDDLCERAFRIPDLHGISKKKKNDVEEAITRMKTQWSKIDNSKDFWGSFFHQ